ncbi:MAG: hypothetical protein APG12_00078 [Candidatus Methanofastidiosum methylothiophilum]|uniref:DUF4350 domain-containing protein n=1 Tax=Candidatus Methanofastidiosum methylothiophilum TaxID=1705564 RepID=A0A150IMU6_9EURY|nr:MAG: hypothetical protein APG10_00238 [Candidatus Methanofastidiosum methylthiophilus]KYC48768.1 MAG: hypothetical protein APG11_00079 [Candidatus Methanofastidiosum methylthiophilus]KYC51416.1 MAG: hypothetical protein APG12_00078 [Candidatus Methanofastidiosum methylthiophilus]
MKKYAFALIFLLLSLNFVSAEKTILIDKYHDTDNWWGDPEGTGRYLFQELSSMGFKNKVSTEPFSDSSLKGSDIVVLWNINNPLEESEINALMKFVENGGSLLVLGSHEHDMIDTTRDSLNSLLGHFGIRIMKNGTDDPTNRQGCSCTPIIHNLAKHPINEGIESIILYKPASLEIKGNAIAIARGDNDTFALGSEPLGGENIVIVAVSEKGSGKVAVIGSSFIFDNGKIGDKNNKQFAKNLFAWLGDTPEGSFPSWALYLGMLAIIIAAYILYLKRKSSKKQDLI